MCSCTKFPETCNTQRSVSLKTLWTVCSPTSGSNAKARVTIEPGTVSSPDHHMNLAFLYEISEVTEWQLVRCSCGVVCAKASVYTIHSPWSLHVLQPGLKTVFTWSSTLESTLCSNFHDSRSNTIIEIEYCSRPAQGDFYVRRSTSKITPTKHSKPETSLGIISYTQIDSAVGERLPINNINWRS